MGLWRSAIPLLFLRLSLYTEWLAAGGLEAACGI